MDIDKALADLKATAPREPGDTEAMRERLRAAARRLREDPLEARRIDDLAKRIDRYEKDYRLARTAMNSQDFGSAKRYLRRSAEHGNDEAAYWLAVLLEMGSMRHRLKGHDKKARGLATEAREWCLRAQESGLAQALDQAYHSGDTSSSGPAHAGHHLERSFGPALPEEPQRYHGQPGWRVGSPAAAPSAGETAPSREDSYAIGVDLQPYQFTMALVDGDGQIIGEKTRDLSDMEPEAVVRVLSGAALEIVAATLGPGFPAGQVTLGVQVGGPVDTRSGTVHYFSKHPPETPADRPTEFRWENFPLGPRLEEETGFRAVILNDAVAFAERERWLGVGRLTGDFVVVLIREGVGGAVVTDGEHFKGPVEIGNFRFSSDSFHPSDVGQFGVLELTGGITGIIQGANDNVPDRHITDIETAAAVANEDGPGREAAAAFLSAGVAIACGLSYLVQLAGPSHVVLYAPDAMLRSDSRGGRRFLGQVKNFREAVSFEAYRNCELVLRPTGRTDGAAGAALAALSRCFRIESATSPVSTGAWR
jgi:predicted NBD/HSP70 family sugar kinase